MSPRRTPRRYDLSWSRRNVAAALIACLVASAALALQLRARPVAVGEQIPVWGQRVAAATERVNPNTASAGSLQRLPGIGRVRAAAIVAYRAEHGPAPFASAEDLTKVRGIGPATAAGAEMYMTFAPADGER